MITRSPNQREFIRPRKSARRELDGCVVGHGSERARSHYRANEWIFYLRSRRGRVQASREMEWVFSRLRTGGKESTGRSRKL